MASDPSIVAFIVEQIAAAGEVAARPMFGEYGVYCDGRMVALICDGATIEEASPYPGAKPCLVIDADRWDDADWMAEIVRISAAELPLPKPRRAKPPKG